MKLLILKPDHLGDFVLALPALWEARQCLGKEARIDTLAASANGIWREILPWMGEIIPLRHPRYQRPRPSRWSRLKLTCGALGVAWNLRSRNYDCGVELTSTVNDPLGKLLLIAAGCGKRYGPLGAYSLLNHHGSPQPLGKHQTEILASRFPASWNITGQASPADFMPSSLRHRPEESSGILIAPWAGTTAKQWPIGQWKEFFGCSPHLPLRLLVPPDCQAQAEELAQGTHVELVRTSSILQTLELLARARLVIAVDSAVAHFTWLTGTPLVEIFAATTELERWRSLADGTCLHHFPSCAPCHLEKCNQPRHFCMEGVSVESLVEAIEQKALLIYSKTT